MGKLHATVVLGLTCLLSFATASAQTSATKMSEGSGATGFAVKVSTLGPGAEVAVRVATRRNVRAGVSAFNYSSDFDQDGINYTGTLRLRSAEAHLDFFPWAKAFHISPE